MQFITLTNRHQTYFSTLEDQVTADNPVRIMDVHFPIFNDRTNHIERLISVGDRTD